MFIRVALLLLLAHAVFVESSKIHDILKKVGKRLPKKDNSELALLETVINEEDVYNNLSARRTTQKEVGDCGRTGATCSHESPPVIMETSTKLSIIIESLLEPDMTAEICGDGKILNACGSCADRGLTSFTNTELEGVAWLIDDIEGLKEKPTVKLFFKLFTPAVYQYIEENPNKLPRYWLSGLNSSLTSITVCHEKMKDTFAYTEDQFRSWYVHFGLMWHPKEGADDTYTLQVLELKPDSIIARVTMKLQMGRKEDAPVHDWNFKFSGKKKDGVWYFEKIDVMCDPTIEYKDESLKLIREVVAGKFVDELKYKNGTQWYSTVDFIKQFTKHGHLVMEDCVNDIVGLITQIDLFKKDQDDVHSIKFTKYQIDEETAIDLPAADTATFRFKTVSQAADSTETEKVETEREWSFDIKWDQMDQFFYIEKMGIGCAKPWTVKGVFKSIVDAIGKKK
ncbi:hypothetical protein CRE_06641 [Caenorhabditis remanei]|uniref:NTF2-like domain-containing protein n=1 Tax=Caenorhabditis remanei TaxID=31234 RepID=E3M1X6_CAERE|nr:hypothetical protein CRE_06641 [Caenorhabditis remanei]